MLYWKHAFVPTCGSAEEGEQLGIAPCAVFHTSIVHPGASSAGALRGGGHVLVATLPIWQVSPPRAAGTLGPKHGHICASPSTLCLASQAVKYTELPQPCVQQFHSPDRSVNPS